VLLATLLTLFSGQFCLAGLSYSKEIPVWQWQLMGVVMLVCCKIMAIWVEGLEIIFDVIGRGTFSIQTCRGESRWNMSVAWEFMPFKC
jgi:hypothetical protein